jgi:hypothetical protein
MTYLALGQHITAKKFLTEITYWMEVFTHGIRTQEGHLKQTMIYPDIELAGYNYLKELEMCTTRWESFNFKPDLTRHSGDSDPRSKFRTFWEWLDYPEEVFMAMG